MSHRLLVSAVCWQLEFLATTRGQYDWITLSKIYQSSRKSGKTAGHEIKPQASPARVSPITVFRALRSERAVAADLIERVQHAAVALGCAPDPAARALTSSRSSHVAVLVPLLSNALFVDLLDAAQGALRPAVLIVTGFDCTEAAHALIASSGVPCIPVMETAVGEVPAEGVYSISFSQADAGAAMMQALLDQGRSHIAFAAAQLDPRTLQRAEGYRRAMTKAGLVPRKWLKAERSSLALGRALFAQIRREAPAMDVIFFNNNDLAKGALFAALRMGMRVPAEIAEAGFNDLTGSEQMLPPLTTGRTSRSAIGLEAARMQMALMRGELVKGPQLDLSFESIRRCSA